MSIDYDFVLRGRIFTFIDNPFTVGDSASYQYYEDGVLLVKLDKIVDMGDYRDFELLPQKTINLDKNYLVMPSFVDAHVHYPQLEIIGGYGANLLQWLDKYAFKAEVKYGDVTYAREQAKQFLLSLIDNGITAASVFCSSHPESVQVLFEEADESNLHITAGQVWMDRNAPDALIRDAKTSYDDAEKLIKMWHNHGNLRYALTPRFPITSSPEQFELAQSLMKSHPDLSIQSHISESRGEVDQVKKLFPQMESYAHLYDHYGLLTDKTVLGHGNLLTDNEVDLLADRKISLVHCPSSNEFLGNQPLNIFGLHCRRPDLKLSLASDVGAGTSLTPWNTMAAAYRASQAHGHTLSAIKALYLHTLGGAKTLNIAHKTGQFVKGHQADIAIINTSANRTLMQRMKTVEDLEEELFVLMTLGSTRTVESLYVSGVKLK